MPTNDEQQLILELINRARANPAGEFDELIQDGNGITSNIDSAVDYFAVNLNVFQAQLQEYDSVAPLAFSSALTTSAETHNDLMIQFDRQSHNLPGEPSIVNRITDAGYDRLTTAAESVYAYAYDVLFAHAGFYIDWGFGPNGIQDPAGHRDAMLAARFSEVGTAWQAEDDGNTTIGPFVTTHHYANRSDYQAQVLGVVFDDSDNDEFYDVGEGMGDVLITVTGQGQTYTTTSWASGGYQLVVPDGIYTITFSGAELGGSFTAELLMDGENVKVDLNADSADLSPGDPATEPTGETLTGNGGQDTLAGGEFDDVLIGNGGGDSLYGYQGEDELLGGGGKDFIYGGDDADIIRGNSRGDRLYGENGNDNIWGGGGKDRLYGGNDNDILHGEKRGDRLFGGDGDDDMSGGGGKDLMYGQAGDDDLDGGKRGDRLYGGSGEDELNGGSGNDRVEGGNDDDVLTGGSGADAFVFDTGHGSDVITDFEAASDTIKISASLANGMSIEDIVGNGWTAVDGSFVIDFGGGDQITLSNFDDINGLTDALVI